MDLTKKQSHYIDIKGSFGFVRIILISLLFLSGTVAICGGEIFGSLFFYLIGIIVVSVYDGVQLDVGLKKIRVYTSVLFIRTGKWIPLEKFKYIVVSEVNIRTRKGGGAIVTRIFLSSMNIYKQQSIVLGEYNDHDDAVQKAKEIGRQLKFEVKVNKMEKR